MYSLQAIRSASFAFRRAAAFNTNVPAVACSSLPGLRLMSTSADPLPAFSTEEEKKVYLKLREAFAPKDLHVADISGGCGSMYELRIVSEKFNGTSKLQQQRLVNQVLKDEIKTWHGVRMTTLPSQ